MSMSDTILDKIRADVQRPADFEAFWQGVQAELADVPLEWERLPGAGGETTDLYRGLAALFVAGRPAHLRLAGRAEIPAVRPAAGVSVAAGVLARQPAARPGVSVSRTL